MKHRYKIQTDEGLEDYIGTFESKKKLLEWETKHKSFFTDRGKVLILESYHPKRKSK